MTKYLLWLAALAVAALLIWLPSLIPTGFLAVIGWIVLSGGSIIALAAFLLAAMLGAAFKGT